jgi:hypothetical protein
LFHFLLEEFLYMKTSPLPVKDSNITMLKLSELNMAFDQGGAFYCAITCWVTHGILVFTVSSTVLSYI